MTILKLGVFEFIFLLGYLAFLALIVYAIVATVRYFNRLARRLDQIEGRLDEITDKLNQDY